MGKPIAVLIVDDAADDALLMVRRLRQAGFDVESERVETGPELARQLTSRHWDVVLSDDALPGFSSREALEVLHQHGLDLPFVIVSGTMGEEKAVAAMRAGAHDYLMKDNLVRLGAAVERELREADVRRQRAQAEERIRFLAFRDPLTGLPNRHALVERLRGALAAALTGAQPIGLLTVELRRYEDVQLTLGYTLGEAVLTTVAERLAAGGGESVAHLEGARFALIIDPSRSGLVEELKRRLEEPIVLDGVPLRMEAWFGLATAPQDATDVETLLQRATIALMAARRSLNGFSRYLREKDLHTRRRLGLVSDLVQAMAENQLRLVYQPEVDLRSGALSAAEALVRWDHPVHGGISPDDFLSTLEQSGLLLRFTLWVLDRMLQDRSTMVGLEQLPIAVNLSPQLLQEPHLVEQLAAVLSAHQQSPTSLILEVTETAWIGDVGRAQSLLNRLAGMGIRLCIDDFGTGYSSLGQFRNLPVHALKIDRSFVIPGFRERQDEVVVRAAVDLAHGFGMEVIAEGVENAEALASVIALGCDHAQGYFLSRPLSAADLSRWAATSERLIRS